MLLVSSVQHSDSVIHILILFLWYIYTMEDCAVLFFQSCLTLCDPIDCSPPGSSVHGILQARILEWVAMPCSRGSSWPSNRTCISYFSCIVFFTTRATGEAPYIMFLQSPACHWRGASARKYLNEGAHDRPGWRDVILQPVWFLALEKNHFSEISRNN